MYLDTMEDVLAHSQPLVVDDKLRGLVPFLPLNVPPGLNGLAPELTLRYTTGAIVARSRPRAGPMNAAWSMATSSSRPSAPNRRRSRRALLTRCAIHAKRLHEPRRDRMCKHDQRVDRLVGRTTVARRQ